MNTLLLNQCFLKVMLFVHLLTEAFPRVGGENTNSLARIFSKKGTKTAGTNYYVLTYIKPPKRDQLMTPFNFECLR